MKTINRILFFVLAVIVFGACTQNYIDDISNVEPGSDETAPQVSIKAPIAGYEIKVPEALAPVLIRFEASDDIELGTVTVALNGTQIGSFDEFKDYRRFVYEFTYDSVPTGSHELTITATDLEGKSTTESVAFDKVPPYLPVYEGEIFYMPFDGDFMELNSFQLVTEVGDPGFTSESVVGTNAYSGAAESYLTFPAGDLQSNEFSAVFWMKINATPDRAGILVMSPQDAANPAAQNNRNGGFRFFRENAAGMQRFKLNVGTGDAEVWFDGGASADVDPAANEWVHFAFTIGAAQATVYINGQVVSQGEFDGIDWAGADLLSIMSGAPRFTGWDHLSDLSYMDELRLFNRALTQEEIQGIILTESGEIPQFEGQYGEIFYMPFEDDFTEQATGEDANVVGSPGFGEGIVGKAYAGADGAYLTFPAGSLQNDAFSATFWMSINAVPLRAGILVMSPEDPDNAEYPVKQNKRTSGFRFFREDAAGKQRFKLNVGSGAAETWFDGGASADVDPAAASWVHFAYTISDAEAVVYIDGEVVSQNAFPGIDWTGVDFLTIMSGAPRFTGWDHFSDLSLMDELRIYDRVLTREEIETMITDVNP